MDEVFTLTQRNHDYSSTEEFVYSSQNIYDIIDKMFSVGYAEISDFQIYVTELRQKQYTLERMEG